MNVLDVVLVGLLVLAGISGFHRGLTLQAFSFGGLILGLVVGALLAPWVAGLPDTPGSQAGLAAVALILCAAVGDVAGWFVGHRVRERARATRFGQADAVAGSFVAVVASLLAIWFIGLNLVNGPIASVAKEIRGSAIVRTLDGALPEPPSLLAQVRRFFNRFGFPDVFTGIPPLPAEPVAPPSAGEARAAFDAAARSTVLVEGEACGQIQEGSGFVAAEGYVVTNAHVLAGVDEPFVRTPDGATRVATTVLFDPELDLGILLVEGEAGPAPVIPLAREDAERGDAGVVLGYPGGGPLSSARAAVLRAMDAVGNDIYGTGEAVRSVIELQAVVRPGNSGGPFVLADGTVGGVVFAASSTEDGVGYAIAADEVRPRLAATVGATSEVGTGACLR